MARYIFPAGSVTSTGTRQRLVPYLSTTDETPETEIAYVRGTTETGKGRQSIVTDESGAYTAFVGPEGASTLLLERPNGTRVAVTSSTATTDTTPAGASASALAADPAFTGTYATIEQLAAAGANASDVGYDVILLAGQSNMLGSNGASDSLLDPVDSRIWRWVAAGNGQSALTAYKSMISVASDPLGHPQASGDVGPGLPFAREYVRTVAPNRRVLLVPTAVGSTALVPTSGTTWNSTVTGSLCDQAVGLANAAIAAAGANARLVAVLWIQGEQDASVSASSSAYQSALDALFAAFRSRITGATGATPIVLGSMVPAWTAAPNGTSVSIAAVHAETPARVAYTGYAVGPTGTAGNVHYSQAEQRILGVSMHAAYRTARTNTLTPTAPGAPSSLSASSATMTSVALAWSAPTASPAVTDYVVEYKLAAAPTWSTFADGVSTTTAVTVTGLTNGSSYNFRVSATNSVGTGPASSVATATPSSITITDTFTRADGALGTTETGQTWTNSTGWAITSNAAVSTATTYRPAYVESTLADCTLTATLSAVVEYGALCFRFTDTQNYYVMVVGPANSFFYKLVANSLILVDPGSLGTFTAGDVIAIQMTGNTFVFKKNGTTTATVTDSSHPTATKHGIWSNGVGFGIASVSITQ